MSEFSQYDYAVTVICSTNGTYNQSMITLKNMNQIDETQNVIVTAAYMLGEKGIEMFEASESPGKKIIDQCR